MLRWFCSSPTFRPKHYLGGMMVLCLLSLIYFNALRGIFLTDTSYSWQWIGDSYLHHILWFSFKQAFLSTFLSIVFGILVARALFYQDFYGKRWLIRLFSLTFVLPSLVVIFGILGIYGTNGWLVSWAKDLGFSVALNIYGLTGILITHLFFNIPFASRLFLQSYQAIPVQQRQLAAQLNIGAWQFIRLVEWPYIRQQLLPTFVLIFMLCFTSFTIVLTLGGGPQYTTLEVAIYQAIIFDFDLPKAAFYALLQFILCFLLFTLSSLLSKPLITDLNYRQQWFPKQKSAVRFLQIFIILAISAFVLLPLFSTLINGLLSQALWSFWQNSQLWRSMAYSITISISSACLALVFASLLLLLSRRLAWLHWQKTANLLVNFGMLILSVPTLLLAIGLFIWLQSISFNTLTLFIVVVVCNALAAMPFVIRILSVPMNYNMRYYEKLCQSLGIRGWQRLHLIEWQSLAQPMKYAFALAAALSLGDFTAIALFGNQQFTSLPYLLYQQLGSYRGDEAAVTALILLMFCLSLFLIVEKNTTQPILQNKENI